MSDHRLSTWRPDMVADPAGRWVLRSASDSLVYDLEAEILRLRKKVAELSEMLFEEVGEDAEGRARGRDHE